jgi:purine nucleoside phosphorylase
MASHGAADMITPAVAYLRSRMAAGFVPEVAIVCGSGLSELSAQVTQQVVVNYRDIPGFPPTTVGGASGLASPLHGRCSAYGPRGGTRHA